MKRTLYSKFIMAYILLGVLGTVLIATLGSSLIQNHILEDTGAALYKEAISLASYQANTDYSDSEDVEAAYNQLKTALCLSGFPDSHPESVRAAVDRYEQSLQFRGTKSDQKL